MKKALIIEERKAKAAQKLERRLQLSKMTHEEREQVWKEEMSEGILGGEEVEEGEEVAEERQAVTKRPIRAEERKTKKQRRKEQMRRKEV